MISLQKYLNELDFDYILVKISKYDFEKLGLDILEEGKWGQSNKKGWSQRVDPERPEINLQRHVHIARTKHTSSKNQQVAWNQDGTRHDQKTSNTNLSGINTAKKIARDALGIKKDIIIEHLSDAGRLIFLTESSNDVVSSAPFEPIHLSIKL